MHITYKSFIVAMGLGLACSVGMVNANDIAMVETNNGNVTWLPNGDYNKLILTIGTPSQGNVTADFTNANPSYQPTENGLYHYELLVPLTATLGRGISRNTQTFTTSRGRVQTGVFSVVDGQVVDNTLVEE